MLVAISTTACVKMADSIWFDKLTMSGLTDPLSIFGVITAGILRLA
jgi:hypothetical protein